nr:MAG TPA: hypothetical protein [Caudoviricetes sp.]
MECCSIGLGLFLTLIQIKSGLDFCQLLFGFFECKKSI